MSIAVLTAVSLGGCGSIVRGTSEQVAFVTSPAGATMTTDSKYACPSTPCSLEVSRSDAFNVTFSKPGYQSVTVPVTLEVSGGGAAGVAGNILAGGIIGVGVDAATGAALDHKPNPVIANLVPIGSAAPAKPARRRPVDPRS